MTACLPAASSRRSFPAPRQRRLRSLRALRGSASDLEIVFVPSAVASRRPLRERRLAAGASRSAHEADLGQSGARESEDRRNARPRDRRCGPCRVFRPLARAARISPAGNDGRRRRVDARLWPFAGRTGGLWSRVQRVHGPKLQCTGLQQRGQAHQARAPLPALGDAGARQHGGAPDRAGVHSDRASIDRLPPRLAGGRQAAATEKPAASRARGECPAAPTREPGALGVFAEAPAALLTLEPACLRSGPPVGNDDRPERLHRLQRVHDGLPEREQHSGRRQGSRSSKGREMHWIRVDRYFSGDPSGSPEVVLPARPLHALRGRAMRTGLSRGRHRSRR